MAVHVKDLNHLKQLVKDDAMSDFYVALNYGLRSSKAIMRTEEGKWFVTHEIDDFDEDFDDDDEFMNSFIGEALTQGALFKH